MHRRQCLVLSTLALLLAGAVGCERSQPEFPPPTGDRVVLIGIDAGTWDVIRPLLAKGDLPNVRGLMERGWSGVLRSMEPMVSPALWTTIASGRPPEQHGIRLPRGFGNDVEAPVHAVDEIDVRDAGRPEHDVGSRRPAAGRMACQIFRSDVRFSFDDTPGQKPVARLSDQVFADQTAGDVERRAIEVRARKNFGPFLCNHLLGYRLGSYPAHFLDRCLRP